MSNDRTLPQEILTDVLSQLPAKSLCRFNSVSPSWNFLIFATQPTSIEPTSKTLNISIRIRSLCPPITIADINQTATKLDFSTAKQHDTVEWVRVWGSCDDLLLVSDEGNSNFILLNPSTRECKKLLTCPFFHALVGVGEFVAYTYGVGYYSFIDGYDSCTDGYEVVMLSYSSLSDITIVAVYSLRNDAWRRLRDFPSMLMRYTCGVLFNGCLHWLGWRAGSFAIVAIDLSDEFFRKVPLHVALDACKIGLFYELVVLGDCLCLVYRQLSY
ncbi:F-box/kelch-repeat protein At3g06240-like [Rhododendron vialii]|uniref:F-box/kelch-repeat protein At3g06240-like n=1 Tax=Rhododendron vialii TaxID=182163 RepID=UPI00265D8FEB|nr:F-box/kelch-repeat protein At3g06240-like [Rhododendron vialii]